MTIKDYTKVCLPGGGSSSCTVGGGIRILFGSRSSKSFFTWLVLSLLFLRFFSSSRASSIQEKVILRSEGKREQTHNRKQEETHTDHLHLLFKIHVCLLVCLWHRIQVVDGQPAIQHINHHWSQGLNMGADIKVWSLFKRHLSLQIDFYCRCNIYNSNCFRKINKERWKHNT